MAVHNTGGPPVYATRGWLSLHFPLTIFSMADEASSVMGRVDAFDVGSKKLTVQTEFFPRPNPRLETKVYLGGALKKVFTEEVDTADADVQALLHAAHQKRVKEILRGLEGLQPR